ncbi:MAG: DUF72 domain-containing protein [Planctomycetes bacterium]|nr:DUF72 domain-containing protein [Planctomycetota bacterium]
MAARAQAPAARVPAAGRTIVSCRTVARAAARPIGDTRRAMGHLRYGTSSWSEPSWEGVFYPEGAKPGEYLGHYATHFDTVEADVTYYRVPDAKMVRGWYQKTPPGFTLCAKFPRSIVHGGDAATPDPARLLVPDAVGGDTGRFLGAMAELHEKCGPLVLQFPYFNRKAFASAAPFLERLDAYLGTLPAAFRYGVEVRNKAWIGAPLLDLLRRHRCALVLVDLVYMPHPCDLAERLDLLTTDFGYVRLIGDRKAVEEKTDRFDRIVVDQSARLDLWAGLLRRYLARVPVIYAYANNHYAGHGPATIRDLVARLG